MSQVNSVREQGFETIAGGIKPPSRRNGIHPVRNSGFSDGVKNIKILFVLIGTFIVAAAGCGSANKEAAFDPNTGKHPADWVVNHGTSAKAMPNITSTTGFSTCQKCHGANFAGGAGVTCLNTDGCHGVGVNAPHSVPWVASARTHITTNTGNAPVCGLCHTNGANSPIPPPTPAPAGTPPGCFNNTLCHGAQD